MSVVISHFVITEFFKFLNNSIDQAVKVLI